MGRLIRVVIAVAVLFVIAVAAVGFFGFRYAYEPSEANVLSRTRPSPEAYDLWGRSFTGEEASRLLVTNAGREQLSSSNGAVKVDDGLLKLGRRAFYKETFGNEVFLTDIVGILDGPLHITSVSTAILALHGRATTNLRVEVPETVTIGGRVFQKGSYLDTGLDVPRGALVPLGMSFSVSRWHIRVGITCAACHATVDPDSGKVIEGAPNNDLNAGLLLALGTNSAAYFMHTDVAPLQAVAQDGAHTTVTSTGERQALPEAVALENAVDQAMLMWPRGNFDSLTDMKADPTQNPVSFTWGNHPYGWSGNFMAGPFRGLTSQNNNVHALNSDSLLLADSSEALFSIDKEVYLAILLRNAASAGYRFDSGSGRKASEFWAAVTPARRTPGVNLHDGGVAVGKNADAELGLPGTVDKNIAPDPFNSVRALVDRDLRGKVVDVNAASASLRRMNVQGIGHNYWVDSQAALRVSNSAR
jgi:hypothetical protein